MSTETLKKAGLKITQPRTRVLDVLERASASHAPHHLTAEDVYRNLLDAGSEIGLATVYRVLSQFEEAGLVQRHHFEGGQAVFELAQSSPHDHIVCVQCGKVEEFSDDVIERRQRNIARQREFDLARTSLVLYANCLSCDHDEDTDDN